MTETNINTLKWQKLLGLGYNPVYLLEIPTMENLIELNVEHNKLKELPENIAKFKNLVPLLANNNNLTILPDEIYELGSLELLVVSGNQLSNLLEKLRKMNSLKTLIATGNQLSADNITMIVNALTNCKIYLRAFCAISTIPKSEKEFGVVCEKSNF